MPHPPNALQLFVNRLTLRSELGGEEREAILTLLDRSREAEVRHEFVSTEEQRRHACLVVSGLVARFGQTRGGLRQIVALHLPGDVADLQSVVAPTLPWTLQALTRTTILKVPHDALFDLVARHPAIGLAFWRDGVVDSNILAQWMINYGRKSAVANVAHLICEMYIRYRAIGRTHVRQFSLPLTQGQIADALGLTAIHVNRMLASLKAEGVAAKNGAIITIYDWHRLTGIAEFDPSYLQVEDESIEVS